MYYRFFAITKHASRRCRLLLATRSGARIPGPWLHAPICRALRTASRVVASAGPEKAADPGSVKHKLRQLEHELRPDTAGEAPAKAEGPEPTDSEAGAAADRLKGARAARRMLTVVLLVQLACVVEMGHAPGLPQDVAIAFASFLCPSVTAFLYLLLPTSVGWLVTAKVLRAPQTLLSFTIAGVGGALASMAQHTAGAVSPAAGFMAGSFFLFSFALIHVCVRFVRSDFPRIFASALDVPFSFVPVPLQWFGIETPRGELHRKGLRFILGALALAACDAGGCGAYLGKALEAGLRSVACTPTDVPAGLLGALVGVLWTLVIAPSSPDTVERMWGGSTRAAPAPSGHGDAGSSSEPRTRTPASSPSSDSDLSPDPGSISISSISAADFGRGKLV